MRFEPPAESVRTYRVISHPSLHYRNSRFHVNDVLQVVRLGLSDFYIFTIRSRFSAGSTRL